MEEEKKKALENQGLSFVMVATGTEAIALRYDDGLMVGVAVAVVMVLT